ncbi:hypothetical protein BDC45DRAFT_538788 [Circinella umbellata]|nr:hypothetical protein BDC45DRAFT_538788 [Circinella umbellata]
MEEVVEVLANESTNQMTSLATHGILDLTSKDQNTLTREWLESMFDNLYSNSKQVKNEKNYLERDQTEYNYTISFWCPLFHRRGEGSLRAAKEIDGRRGPVQMESSFTYESCGFEITIIDVTGPPQNGQHKHFVGGHNEIAINLKKTMKKIHGKKNSSAT